MAYYPKTYGLDGYKKRKAREACSCFICHDPIAKGAERYKARFNLCLLCAAEWMNVGGMLGNIPRSKNKVGE